MYKIESMNKKAERYLEANPELAQHKFIDKERAWDVVAELEEQGYGEFCVVEIK